MSARLLAAVVILAGVFALTGVIAAGIPVKPGETVVLIPRPNGPGYEFAITDGPLRPAAPSVPERGDNGVEP